MDKLSFIECTLPIIFNYGLSVYIGHKRKFGVYKGDRNTAYHVYKSYRDTEVTKIHFTLVRFLLLKIETEQPLLHYVSKWRLSALIVIFLWIVYYCRCTNDVDIHCKYMS